METGFDDRVEEFHKLEKGAFVVLLKNDECIDDVETSKINRMPSDFCALILSYSNEAMNEK